MAFKAVISTSIADIFTSNASEERPRCRLSSMRKRTRALLADRRAHASTIDLERCELSFGNEAARQRSQLEPFCAPLPASKASITLGLAPRPRLPNN